MTRYFAHISHKGKAKMSGHLVHLTIMTLAGSTRLSEHLPARREEPRSYAPPSLGPGFYPRLRYLDNETGSEIGPRARLELQYVDGPLFFFSRAENDSLPLIDSGPSVF